MTPQEIVKRERKTDRKKDRQTRKRKESKR